MKDCLFCKIIRRDIPSKIRYEDERLIAIDDINPKAPVHILIIPKKHIPTPYDISDIDRELIGAAFVAANKLAAENSIVESGFRLVANCNKGAGQTVFHIHFHLLGGRVMGWPPG